ncbi:MAG: ABC transporter permease, partial [Brooklawnia sp.]
LTHFGCERYAEVFKQLTENPRVHADRWASGHQASPPNPSAQLAQPVVDAATPSLRRSRQWSTLIRRQLRIIAADRSYALSTLLLPLVIAAMTLVIPGDTGFGQPPRDGLGEPSQLLVIITVGAAFMGMSASIRELIGERAIFLRERTVGLSPAIYLSAKVCVLFATTLAQSALLITVVRLRKPGPEGAVWASDGTLELWLAAFGTAFVSALLGLLLSAIVSTGEQTMPALVVTVMAQLVFCGGLVTITDRGALEVVAAISPSRWGFAMSASTVDLTALNPSVAQDSLWQHSTSAWLTSAGALVGIGLVCVGLTAIKLFRQTSKT